MSERLTIGGAARLSGVPAKTIRYYEGIGLLAPAQRGDNGYRLYDERTVNQLRFISRARGLGFPVKDVENLLALWADPRRKSAEVREVAEAHLRAIDRKIGELQGLRTTLLDLVELCHGDERPDCPILDDLAGDFTENGR